MANQIAIRCGVAGWGKCDFQSNTELNTQLSRLIPHFIHDFDESGWYSICRISWRLSKSYQVITMTSEWARWRLKSPGSRLFTQPFIQGADQRKYQSSASLAFVRGIHRWPVNSPHKWPVTRKKFPSDDVIIFYYMLIYPLRTVVELH